MAHDMDYLKSLGRVSRALGSTFKKNELLMLIVDAAIESMNAKAACLFLGNQDPGLYFPAASRGLSPDYKHTAPEKAKKQMGELIKKGFLSVYDATKDPRVGNHNAKKAEGIRSILAVPVIVHDRPIGVLTLYTAEHREFSEADILFLTVLAGQGGIAVDRARLIVHIRKNSKLFYDLSADINASLDLKKIISTLTVELCHAFKAKGVSVELIDLDGHTLRPVSSHGLNESFLKMVSGTDGIKVDDVLNGKTVVVPGGDLPKNYKDEGIAAIVSAPITAGKSIMGVLRLFFEDPRDFYEDETLMVAAFANQTGLAIHNAICYEKVESDLKDLKADLWSHRSWF